MYNTHFEIDPLKGEGLVINRTSPPEEKIRLFRSLFRGREDVFARRFESRKTGRGGYAPACRNEWVRGICEKPRIKCADCRNRAFIPIGEEEVHAHLTGCDHQGKSFVMGLYPMLGDETCWFLAVDLDEEGWREDAVALLDVCGRLEVPAALERSRSGNGGHVWIFFAEPLPASLARKLGSSLLTAAMNERPDLGFSSYDRLFPNQDTLPRGGFGNLIALPLQGAARKRGNSVFLNEAFQPHEDQWAFLSSIRRMGRHEVEERVGRAEREGSVLGVRPVPDEAFALEPWKAPPSRRAEVPVTGPLPERIGFVLSDQIYLPRDSLTPSLRNRLLRLAAFQNPEFYKAQAMRLPTYEKPRIIACAEEFEDHLALPRGCLEEMTALFRSLGIRYRRKDKRIRGSSLDVTFQGTLRDDQRKAAEEMIRFDTGVLSATTAFGKTVLAAWMIAERGVNTLVLVHRRQLMDQWVERLVEFLGLDAKEIGCLGGGRRKLKGRVDIALLQSVVRKGVVDDRVADYGQVIVDECHHVSARNFELAVRRAKAKYVLGLSATVTRKDGHHPIVFMQCGPVRHRVEAVTHAGTSSLVRQILVRPTRFQLPASEEETEVPDFTRLMELLMYDEVRNQVI
ncbi:MAG: DEAD/DEAH box helicase family protein, partial [Kiritimatiellia bacterium]